MNERKAMKIGLGASITACKENQEILDAIEASPDLTPEQLLDLASRYRDHVATLALAHHLAAHAMAMLARSPAVDQAMDSISHTEIEWSWLGDAWKKVKNFFTGGSDKKDTTNPCKIKCAGGAWTPVSVLVEKCGGNDDWHVIGVCFFGKH